MISFGRWIVDDGKIHTSQNLADMFKKEITQDKFIYYSFLVGKDDGVDKNISKSKFGAYSSGNNSGGFVVITLQVGYF